MDKYKLHNRDNIIDYLSYKECNIDIAVTLSTKDLVRLLHLNGVYKDFIRYVKGI